MPKPLFRPQADEDLIDIWLYVAIDNERAADRLIKRLKTACERLGDMPKMGRIRPDIAPNLRYFAVDAYVILYLEISGQVDVVRIVHGARDLPNLV